MDALTIKQPWLWCITDLTDKPKRVENRSWKPPYRIIGQRIALHASKRIDQAEMTACRRVCLSPLPRTREFVAGAIVATAIVQGYVVVNGQGGVVEQSRLAASYTPRSDPWFFGPVGWLLEDVQKLPAPIFCKGALGLWRVPADIAAMIAEAPNVS